MIYSFDIFDTCLTRNYAAPRHLFIALGERFLKNYAPYGYDQQSIRLFARLRRLAERQARFIHKNSREDITLPHIYQQLGELLPWTFDCDEAMCLEMELEKSSLQVVLPIKHRIELLRQQGRRVIFISDMYLPTEFIRQCLLDKGIAQEHDAVYVSGEWGLTKASGNLFRKIVELEAISPQQWLHCGDNYHSDINMPAQLGIQTHYFMGAHLTPFEQRALKHIPHQPLFPSYSKLVGASRVARLNLMDCDVPLIDQDQGSDITPFQEVITTVAGPLLTAYVAWLLQDAKQKGIERLYFVSRDGQILLKIAQKLCANLSEAPELRYLYGSRQAWFLPSVLENDWDELAWVTQSDSNCVIDLLNRLSITQDEVENYLIQYRLDVYLYHEATGEVLNRFKAFISNDDIFNIIQNKACELRIHAIDYFYQEGLFDDERWSIVDLGWKLSCQHALCKIIRSVNPEQTIQGYYLGVQKKSASIEDAGYRYVFIDQQGDGFIKNSCHWLFRSNIRLIIEHLFASADHPSVLRYKKQNNGVVVPVFADHCFLPLSDLLSASVLNYIDYIKLEDLFPSLDLYANAAVNNAELFFTRPEPDTVNNLADLTINRDQSHDASYERKLASAMDVFEVLRLIAGKGYDLKRHVWLEGSAALSPLFSKLMLRTVLSIRNILFLFR